MIKSDLIKSFDEGWIGSIKLVSKPLWWDHLYFLLFRDNPVIKGRPFWIIFYGISWYIKSWINLIGKELVNAFYGKRKPCLSFCFCPSMLKWHSPGWNDDHQLASLSCAYFFSIFSPFFPFPFIFIFLSRLLFDVFAIFFVSMIALLLTFLSFFYDSFFWFTLLSLWKNVIIQLLYILTFKVNLNGHILFFLFPQAQWYL